MEASWDVVIRSQTLKSFVPAKWCFYGLPQKITLPQTRLFRAGKLYHGTLKYYPAQKAGLLENWKLPLVPSIHSTKSSGVACPCPVPCERHSHSDRLPVLNGLLSCSRSWIVAWPCSSDMPTQPKKGKVMIFGRPHKILRIFFFKKFGRESDLAFVWKNCSFTQGLVAWFFSKQAVFPVALLVIGNVFFLHWVPKHLDLKDW